MKNYYKILGVRMTATGEDVKRAYRQLAKRFHPDLHPGDADIAARFAEINEANDTLSDAGKRAEYDKQVNEILAKKAAVNQTPHANAAYAAGRAGQFAAQKPFAHSANAAANAAFIYRQTQAQAQAAYNQSYEQAYKMANDAQKLGYNQGYAQGFSDAQKQGAEQLERLKRTADGAERQLGDERRRTRELALRIDELSAEVERLSAQSREKPTANTDGKDKIERMAAQMRSYEEALLREADGRKQSEAEIARLTGEIKKLRGENEHLRATVDEWERYGRAEEENAELTATVDDWQRKLKEDKKWLKNTHYGTLGVMFWVVPTQIDEAFEKLKKRYAKKVLAGDEKYKEKLKAAGAAYKVLSDAKARRAYNNELDIGDEEIEQCRIDEREYLKALTLLSENSRAAEMNALIDELYDDAEAGDGAAANELGELLLSGEGVEKDEQQAVKFFRMAADAGDAEGMFNLGLCLLNGTGAESDAIEGVRLIKQAADAGSPGAIEFRSNL